MKTLGEKEEGLVTSIFSFCSMFFTIFPKQLSILRHCKKNIYENIGAKGEKAGYQHFLLFLHTVFSSFSQNNFHFLVTRILFSAKAIDLGRSKIPPFGK